jgi:hypothetical protein
MARERWTDAAGGAWAWLSGLLLGLALAWLPRWLSVSSAELSRAATEAAKFALVGALWGCTNPFLERGARRARDDSAASAPPSKASGLAAVAAVLSRWRFLLPLALNQLGSALFTLLLGSADMSLAVPLANSLAFVFTALTAWALGEPPTARASGEARTLCRHDGRRRARRDGRCPLLRQPRRDLSASRATLESEMLNATGCQ